MWGDGAGTGVSLSLSINLYIGTLNITHTDESFCEEIEVEVFCFPGGTL